MNPCIRVCDIETTISWYEHFLDFNCTYKSSLKNPDNAIIEKGKVKIFVVKGDQQECYASNILVVEVDNLAALYEEFESGGKVIIWQSIGEEMFGSEQFIIKDYEDNKIIYKQKT